MGNNTGWICPVCGRVHAPWVPSCECKGQIKYNINTNTNTISSTTDIKFETSSNNTQMICD